MSDLLLATIEEPKRGTWVADISETGPFTGSFVFGVSWTGTAVDTIKDGGRYLSRVVGGKGRLGTQLREKYYTNVSAQRIFEDMIKEAGETLGKSSISGTLAAYQRQNGTLGECLDQLCDLLGLDWWIARDGTSRIGKRTSQNVLGLDIVQTAADSDGSVVLNTDSVSKVLPGYSYNGSTIEGLRWHLSDHILCELAFTPVPVPLDLARDYYLKQYAAKVDKQNPDGTLELIAEGRFTLSKVTLFSGVPSSKLILNPGDSCLVGFLGGDPRTPYAIASTMRADGRPAARKSDPVDAGTILLVCSPAGTLSAAQYFPAGAIGEQAAQAAALLATQSGQIPYVLKMNSGLISDGNPQVLL